MQEKILSFSASKSTETPAFILGGGFSVYIRPTEASEPVPSGIQLYWHPSESLSAQ